MIATIAHKLLEGALVKNYVGDGCGGHVGYMSFFIVRFKSQQILLKSWKNLTDE